jgi:hypothetical protein
MGNRFERVNLTTNANEPIGPILENHRYRQTFVSNHNGLFGIAIQFATYAEEKSCNVYVKITDTTSTEIVFESNFSAKKLRDNEFFEFRFHPQRNSKNRHYEIEILSDAKTFEEAVTIWASVSNSGNSKDYSKKVQLAADTFGIELTDLNLTAFSVDTEFIDQTLNIQTLYSNPVDNKILTLWLIVTLGFASLLLLLSNYKWCVSSKTVIIVIYALVIAFSVFKMVEYVDFGGFPDENPHISYVAYLKATGVHMPSFAKQKIIVNTNLTTENGEALFLFGNSTNYLGHPPFYYHFLRLSGAVRAENEFLLINVNKLRMFACIISMSALLLLLYIGYSRIEKIPILHLLYALSLTSIPMFTYIAVAINNDNLALLGITLFVLGGMRYSEKKINILTYFLLSIGISITVFAKLTAGLIVIAAAIAFILYYALKNRNMKILICPQFAITIPIYFLVVVYFIMVYRQVGAFHPSFAAIAPEEYLDSPFYVMPELRSEMGLLQYIFKYIEEFFKTWTGIAGHVPMIKQDLFLSINRIAQMAVFFFPIIIAIRGKNKYTPFLSCLYCGVLILFMIQIATCYLSFLSSGRFGGYSARYYLCAMPVFALSCVLFFQDQWRQGDFEDSRLVTITETQGAIVSLQMNKNKLLIIASLTFSVLLFYEDFVYFLMHL